MFQRVRRVGRYEYSEIVLGQRHKTRNGSTWRRSWPASGGKPQVYSSLGKQSVNGESRRAAGAGHSAPAKSGASALLAGATSYRERNGSSLAGPMVRGLDRAKHFQAQAVRRGLL